MNNNNKLVSSIDTVEKTMRKILMESEMRPIESPKVEAFILSNLSRFTDIVETKDGAKVFLVKNKFRESVNISNKARDAWRKNGGGKGIAEVNEEQLEELKQGIVPLHRDVKNKAETATKVSSTVIRERTAGASKKAAVITKRASKPAGKSPIAVSKTISSPAASKSNDQAPLYAPEPKKAIPEANVTTTKVEQKKAVTVVSKNVSTGNAAVKACNESGIDSPVFKNTCKAFGVALIALGIYIGYKMYPSAKEQFIKAWNNGNPNAERLTALLKGVGACLLVVGIIGCGVYLIMHGFKQEATENDNSFTYKVLNGSANVVNSIADLF